MGKGASIDGSVNPASQGKPLAGWYLAVAGALVALPWLNPFAYGPSAYVQPWLTAAACTLVLWLLALASGASCRPRLLLVAGAIAAWAALAHVDVIPAVTMLAAGLLLACIAAGLAKDARTTPALLAGWLAAAALSAVFGLLQYAGLAGGLAPWVNAAVIGEAYGNLRQPNLYATLCWLGAAVVLFQPLALPRAARIGLVALLAVGAATSASRTGMLQGVTLGLLCALWRGPGRRQRLMLCVVAAAAYCAAALLLPIAVEAATGVAPARTAWGRLAAGQGCSSRLVLWSNVLHLIAQKPLVGWGWGELDYAHFATLYPGARFCDILDNAHNLPLHLAVELGLPAALLVCGGGLWWAARQRPWREASDGRRLAWAVLAVILLHGMLEYPLWYGPFQVAFGAALGWLTAPAQSPPQTTHARAWAGVAACALLAGAGYAAWDYVRVSQIYVQPEDRVAAWRDDTTAHIRRSWLFAGQARFAELTLSAVTRANAAVLAPMAQEVLHFSPEPRVIERAIESETALGQSQSAALDLARFRAAFPKEYEEWRAMQKRPLPKAPGLPY